MVIYDIKEHLDLGTKYLVFLTQKQHVQLLIPNLFSLLQSLHEMRKVLAFSVTMESSKGHLLGLTFKMSLKCL